MTYQIVQNYDKGLAWYERQFSILPTARAVGEFTPNYFWTTEDGVGARDIPKLVHDAYPDLTLIVSLRNPVDRAISAYYHHIKQGRVSPRQNISEAADHHGITSMGYYDVHLNNWTRYYPLRHFLVLIYEHDLHDDCKRTTMRRVFQHIGVDDRFEPDGMLAKYNVRRSDFDLRTRHYPSLIRRGLQRALPERVRMSRIWDIAVGEDEKHMLADTFEPHNRKLEDLIGRTLPWPSE